MRGPLAAAYEYHFTAYQLTWWVGALIAVAILIAGLIVIAFVVRRRK